MNTERQEFTDSLRTILSSLSHDIRSPLATLQSFLNILEMDEYALPPEELKEMAQSLGVASKRALESIDAKLSEISQLIKASEK